MKKRRGKKLHLCCFHPFCLVDNWVRELKLWCPSLKVVVYYGKTHHSSFDLKQSLCEPCSWSGRLNCSVWSRIHRSGWVMFLQKDVSACGHVTLQQKAPLLGTKGKIWSSSGRFPKPQCSLCTCETRYCLTLGRQDLGLISSTVSGVCTLLEPSVTPLYPVNASIPTIAVPKGILLYFLENNFSGTPWGIFVKFDKESELGKIIRFYWSLCHLTPYFTFQSGNEVVALVQTKKLSSFFKKIVIHHKFSDFARIELWVIVITPCDEVLHQSQSSTL